jgi:hypothetical protein
VRPRIGTIKDLPTHKLVGLTSESILSTVGVRIYDVKERYLQEFLDKIEPFGELWRSVRFVGYAGKVGGTWTLLGGRMQLSAKTVDSEVLTRTFGS